MTPPHSDFPSHKINMSALSLRAKLTILLQKISDGTYVPNSAPPHPYRIPKFIKYHLSAASILDQKRAVDTWAVCLQMCCHGLCFPVCLVHRLPHCILQHSFSHSLLLLLLPLCNGVWKKGCLWISLDTSVKVILGSFLDPLHTVYREATKALPADCTMSKGRLWAKPGKRPAADSEAAGI